MEFETFFSPNSCSPKTFTVCGKHWRNGHGNPDGLQQTKRTEVKKKN